MATDKIEDGKDVKLRKSPVAKEIQEKIEGDEKISDVLIALEAMKRSRTVRNIGAGQLLTRGHYQKVT